MRIKNLTCDHCGRPIRTISEGWLEYLVKQHAGSEKKSQLKKIRITHAARAFDPPNTKCMTQEVKTKEGWIRLDNHLCSFTGKEGLKGLLGMADWLEIENVPEYLDVVLRLHSENYVKE